MFFGRSILLTTNASREALVARLAATVLSTEAIAPHRPVRISDWVSQHRGKRFVGKIEGQRFKLGMLRAPRAGFRWRGSVVVIVGSVDDQSLRARLRPPLFMLAFLAAFAAGMLAGLVLSFFGPANIPAVHLLLWLGLVLPIAIVVWVFRREATEAEQALRQAISASGQP